MHQEVERALLFQVWKGKAKKTKRKEKSLVGGGGFTAQEYNVAVTAASFLTKWKFQFLEQKKNKKSREKRKTTEK